MKVAIVGGGIAGLSAAYELSRRQVPCGVFESASRAGGVCLSETIDGFTIDAGPDSLLVQKRDAVQLCEELGLAERLIPSSLPRVAFVQRGGRLHPLPASSVLGIPTRLGPFVRTRLFSWPGKLRMAAELAIGRQDTVADESIGAFITRRFGSEACTYLAEPLLAGIHAGDVDRLSIRALFPRLVEAERSHGSVIRAFWRERARPAADGAFRSLPGGLSEIVAALVGALPAGTLRLGAAVDRVSDSPDGATVELQSGERVAASAVVVAAPAFVAARLFRDADPGLATLCGEIPYASTATVALAFSREAVRHALDGSGFVVPRVEARGILAASWMSSKWAHRAPEGRVLVRAFVGGGRDPRVLDRSDAELVSLALGALEPIMGLSGRPLLSRVYRWPRASAQHEVGHLARLSRIEGALAAHPRLFLTGSGFRGVGIPDCVADARRVAGTVAALVAESRTAHSSSSEPR